VILLVFSQYAYPQTLSYDPASGGLEADTLFENLSITERISQLLLIDGRFKALDGDDFPMEIGGILMNETSPHSHLKKVQSLRRLVIPGPLIFSGLTKTIGVGMDSVTQFGSPGVFRNIDEPHLYYETGSAVAMQCRLLGISAFLPFPLDSLFGGSDTDFDWKFKEFQQGLVDGGMLPFDAIRVVSFDTLEIEYLKSADNVLMILMNEDSIPGFHQMIQEAMSEEKIDLETLEALSKKILKLKIQRDGDIINLADVENRLKKLNLEYLNFELAKASINVLVGSDSLVPVEDLANKKIASLNFEGTGDPVFDEYLDRYTAIDHFDGRYDMSEEAFTELWNKLVNYDIVVCALHNSGSGIASSRNFKTFFGWLQTSSKCIFVSFLDRDQLLPLKDWFQGTGLIIAPEDSKIYQSIVPQIIFGGIRFEGGLPTDSGRRTNFSYTYPEAAGLSSNILARIDSLAILAIAEGATPGCQILVAKDNQVVFQKSYGYHIYDSLREVRNDDLYDLASVTKVSGALPALMKLYEEGKFDLDATLGTYVKYFRHGNKKNLTFREILAHQSGLMPYITYWRTTQKKNGKYKHRTLSTMQSAKYPYEVAQGIFLHKDYRKQIYRQIRKTDLGEKKYLYSGLTFLIFPEIIENISGQKYKDYLYTNFYKPLGATTVTYNPLEKFDLDRIVPTEYDSLFRKSQIQGKVHDEAAAMMQGISSNAGLFASANDLAKLWQMYCSYGEFGGKRYLKEETVKEFARCQYPENDNRRGLGFDRPMPEPTPDGNTAVSVSQSSFGHTGFTGTFAWADPEYHLVYIFLSNRVYPTRANTKLYKLNIRTNIQQVIYDAMIGDE
jgi:CubicO group peptidase (beta-lactamase class C family)